VGNPDEEETDAERTREWTGKFSTGVAGDIKQAWAAEGR
jgi:hypothetical protein